MHNIARAAAKRVAEQREAIAKLLVVVGPISFISDAWHSPVAIHDSEAAIV